MESTISRAMRTLLVIALVLAMIMPAALAETQIKASTLATSVRLEASCPVYIGNDGVGTKRILQYSILPIGASANKDAYMRDWVSDDERIVTVSSTGEIKAVNFGTTYVRLYVEDGSGLSAKCKVTVSKQPVTAVKLNYNDLIKLPGTTFSLKATAEPANAYNADIKWKSSNTKIATVSQAGVIKMLKPGVVKIKAYNGSNYALCTIQCGYDFDKTGFNVLTIVNTDYPASIGSVPHFAPTAGEVYSFYEAMEDNGFVKSLAWHENRTGAQIRAELTNLTKLKTSVNDVTVVYFSGRGSTSSVDQTQRGALLGIDADKPTGAVSIAEVQAILDKVPGTIVLILDCNMAGQWIKAKDAASNMLFNQMVIDQFKKSTATNFNAKAIEGAAKTKYKILASCSNSGNPYGVWNDDDEVGYSLFGQALSWAFGGKADTNKDGIVTLRETYNYTAPKVKSLVKRYNKAFKKSVSQTVNVWPTNDYMLICVTDASAGDDFGDFEDEF